MSQSKKSANMKNIYVWGFPINLSLELLIQFISLLLPVYVVVKSIKTSSILIISLAILLAIYLYPLTILFLSALITRLLPKPKKLKDLKTFSDRLKFQTLIALNTFVRRTPARWLLIFPFPGYLFYKLSGTKIAATALVTSPDSLQDVYLVSIGENSLLGWGSLVLGHCSNDGKNTLLGKVDIGDNVLIGEQTTVWPNVKIGNGSIIQNKSVIQYGAIIPANEIWGGIPARKIRSREENSFSIPLPETEEVAQYIQQLLLNNYDIQNLDRDAPLLDLGLTAYEITRILNNLEKRYDELFFDRTEIELENFSFNDILITIDKYQKF